MSFVVASDLTRTFDLSDPWIVRALTLRPKRILKAVDAVNFQIERGSTYALVGEVWLGQVDDRQHGCRPAAALVGVDHHRRP